MQPVVSVGKDSKLTMDKVHTGKIKFGIQRGTSEADWLEQNKRQERLEHGNRLLRHPARH